MSTKLKLKKAKIYKLSDIDQQDTEKILFVTQVNMYATCGDCACQVEGEME